MEVLGPLGIDLYYLKGGITGQRPKPIGIKAPAVNRIPMLRSSGRRDDTTDATRLKHPVDFQKGQPEVLDMLQRLTRDHHIQGIPLQFNPPIGIPQDQIDVNDIETLAVNAPTLPA